MSKMGDWLMEQSEQIAALKRQLAECQAQLNFHIGDANRMRAILMDYNVTRETLLSAWQEIDEAIERMNEEDTDHE